MATLSNGRVGAGYLAVELTVDKRLQPASAFSRGPVFSWTAPEGLFDDLVETPADWPSIDRTKIGWLNCTIKFIVGETVIYQQSLLVQYTTFWEWFYTIEGLLATEHEDEQVVYSGMESPELIMELRRYPFDPDFFDEEPVGVVYGYTLGVYVDTSIGAGEPGVSHEGPGMFLHPSEEEVLTFARQLIEEADNAG